MKPIISVIIPVYNCEKYVERAAMSVLNQPCAENIDLLLVNDGSKDGSGKILDRIGADRNNVRVFHKENGGVSSARNLGIKSATGKYLAFLDADDWWEPDSFDECLLDELSNENSADMYGFGYQKITGSLNYKRVIAADGFAYHYDSPCQKQLPLMPHWSYFYKKTLIENNELEYLPVRIWEDVPFAEMSMYYALSVTSINKTLYNYYQNDNSCLHKNDRIIFYLEKLKALNIKKEMFASRGIVHEIDSEILSTIAVLLPDWCAQNSFRKVWEFTQSDACYVLRDENIKSWQSMQKTCDSWKKHPKLFWLKSKIHPGIAYAVKRFCYSIPLLRKPVDYLLHRFILKWEKTDR